MMLMVAASAKLVPVMLAVRVAFTGTLEAMLVGGVYCVLVPVAGVMLPGPLSVQVIVPVALTIAAVKVVAGAPGLAVTVAVLGLTVTVCAPVTLSLNFVELDAP